MAVQAELVGFAIGALIAGTLPGVMVGASIRVFVVPGPTVFRVLVALLLLPLSLWLCVRAVRPPKHQTGQPSTRFITAVALAVGTVGGIYGIGGGSILGPILVGRGMPIARVAPAALASTFLTSLVGAGTYAVLSLTAPGDIAPDWSVGFACGLGGLVGGYLGARLQPLTRVRETTAVDHARPDIALMNVRMQAMNVIEPTRRRR
ncbi:TSUP family transporter [Actinomadura madurae]|uniref:TSUP family transporter n=1 Tax=Actinomadura madurae TaxID=1993 RepID=UPI0020262CBE|nr:TSUP family transporter [Actinomadura madurae]URM96623.1 TSUP family transporter [Actinomadura madurae]